jgi:hypothetical protein
VLTITDATVVINYGLNKVRFPAPVPCGSRIRLSASLKDVNPIPGGVQLTLAAVVEREGADKPVCIAEPILRFLNAAEPRPSAASTRLHHQDPHGDHQPRVATLSTPAAFCF